MRYNIVAVSAILFFVICAIGTTYGASATISFEGFGNEGDLVGSLPVTPAFDISFRTETAAGIAHTPFLAEIGAPRVGFQSVIGEETPMNADGSVYTEGGRFSLTDGLRQTLDYVLDFPVPVENLSLDLYDYRGDGPHVSANLGSDSVELQVFDEAGTQIGVDSYVLPAIRPIEGNVVNLGVSATGIRSARLHFNGTEGGTAIDNISFTIVPEPAGMGLLGFGLLGLLGLRRRERQAA